MKFLQSERRIAHCRAIKIGNAKARRRGLAARRAQPFRAAAVAHDSLCAAYRGPDPPADTRALPPQPARIPHRQRRDRQRRQVARWRRVGVPLVEVGEAVDTASLGTGLRLVLEGAMKDLHELGVVESAAAIRTGDITAEVLAAVEEVAARLRAELGDDQVAA